MYDTLRVGDLILDGFDNELGVVVKLVRSEVECSERVEFEIVWIDSMCTLDGVMYSSLASSEGVAKWWKITR